MTTHEMAGVGSVLGGNEAYDEQGEQDPLGYRPTQPWGLATKTAASIRESACCRSGAQGGILADRWSPHQPMGGRLSSRDDVSAAPAPKR